MTQTVLVEPNGRELVAARASVTPMAMMERMMENPNCDPEKLAKFMELHFQYEREQARKDFITALGRFKANPPDIRKTHKVKIATKGGDEMVYYHAELDKINKTIEEALRAVGIIAAWDLDESNGRTVVSLVLRHTPTGHEQKVSTLSAPADTSGGKNNVQAIGSTITYLQRYTLLAGLGLAAVAPDDDAQTADSGMDAQAVKDWLVIIQDCNNLPELQKQWRLAYQAAQASKDPRASREFTEAKDARKKELMA